jgi:two-component system capsular synthesis sensor histidine kinase RcsC
LRRTADNERKELELERQAAQAAYTSQERFLATMSHEVRTPLTAVLGTTRVLLEGELSDVQRARLRTIRQSGRSLMSLLDSSLDFAALREGRIVLEPMPTHIDALLEGLVNLFRSRAEEKGLALELVSDGEVGWLLLDGSRLQQILANLLGNAVKFTADGHVTVRVLRDSPLIISVEDSGPGITDLESVFLPFQQGDHGRRHGGTGLGLSIAQGLTRAMGGKLVVVSEPGVGTRFTLTVSAPVTEPVDERSDLHRALAAQVPARVLVVEDNDVNRKVIVEMMRVLGYVVRAASDGVQARELLAEVPADVVFMDLNMPGQDGLSVTRTLLQQDPDLWVVALTANVQESDRRRCREAGMRDFVPKPFDLSTLAGAMTRWGSRV